VVEDEDFKMNTEEYHDLHDWIEDQGHKVSAAKKKPEGEKPVRKSEERSGNRPPHATS